MNTWDGPHGQVIKSFLKFLNERYPGSFVLKGGAALAVCYDSVRFSHDIDLDGLKGESIVGVVEKFCSEKGYAFRMVKQTDLVERCKIDYGSVGLPLKIEVSHRRKDISPSSMNMVRGIKVYTINELAVQKSSAYTLRDKIRDMYDMGFICERYGKVLTSKTKAGMRKAIIGKGLSHLDYLTRNQPGEVDAKALTDSFVNMCDKLGLMRETHKSTRLVMNRERHRASIPKTAAHKLDGNKKI